MIINIVTMDLDKALKRKRKDYQVKKDADRSRKARKLVADNKEVNKSQEAMHDMALFNTGAYLQTPKARQELLDEYGLSKKWTIDEKNSGNDWVVYTRKKQEEGKPDHVVAYRGTAKIRDAYTDGLIVAGKFHNSPRYQSSKQEFQRIKTDLGGTFVTTGHSLGGLIALALGRDFATPSITFNRAAGWDQLEENLDKVKSINYTTNTGGTTDVVSLASYYLPSDGETVVSIKPKEGNEGWLGAHGLANFLPEEKNEGFFDDLEQEDAQNTHTRLSDEVIETVEEVGGRHPVDKGIDFVKDVTWKMLLGVGSTKLLASLVKRGSISQVSADRVHALQEFYDNPTTFSAKNVGLFLKNKLGSAKDFLTGKLNAGWEKIKNNLPKNPTPEDWEPLELDELELDDLDPSNTVIENRTAGEIAEDAPQDEDAFEIGDIVTDEEELGDDEDLDFEDMGDVERAQRAEDEVGEFFAGDDEFGEFKSGDLQDVDLGPAPAEAAEGIGEGATEVAEGVGEAAGMDVMGPALLPAIFLIEGLQEGLEERRKAAKASWDHLLQKDYIDSMARLQGFDAKKPIEEFIKKHPETAEVLQHPEKSTTAYIDGKQVGETEYDWDYSAFYGPHAARYLAWRYEHQRNGQELPGGISVEQGLKEIQEKYNPYGPDFLNNIRIRRARRDAIIKGDRYINHEYPGGDHWRSNTDHTRWNREKEQERLDKMKEDDIQRVVGDERKMEVIYRRSIDKTVIQSVTDSKGNVHWRREGEIGMPQKDGTIKWTHHTKLPKNTWRSKDHPWKGPQTGSLLDPNQWTYDPNTKTYVHITDKGTKEMPLIPIRNEYIDWNNIRGNTANSRSSEKDTHGGNLPEIDRNSEAGKGRQHPSLTGTNGKHTTDPQSTKNDRKDGLDEGTIEDHQGSSNQGTGKGIKEPNKELTPPGQGERRFSPGLDPAIHHPRDPNQPQGAEDVNTRGNAPGHPPQTPAHQVAPGENHNPFSGTPGTSEHTFGVEGSGGITLRQLHQRSYLQNRYNQQKLGDAADVNFMRSLNAKEGRF